MATPGDNTCPHCPAYESALAAAGEARAKAEMAREVAERERDAALARVAEVEKLVEHWRGEAESHLELIDALNKALDATRRRVDQERARVVEVEREVDKLRQAIGTSVGTCIRCFVELVTEEIDKGFGREVLARLEKAMKETEAPGRWPYRDGGAPTEPTP